MASRPIARHSSIAHHHTQHSPVATLPRASSCAVPATMRWAAVGMPMPGAAQAVRGWNRALLQFAGRRPYGTTSKIAARTGEYWPNWRLVANFKAIHQPWP